MQRSYFVLAAPSRRWEISITRFHENVQSEVPRLVQGYSEGLRDDSDGGLFPQPVQPALPFHDEKPLLAASL
jgi:hypothetical protein